MPDGRVEVQFELLAELFLVPLFIQRSIANMIIGQRAHTHTNTHTSLSVYSVGVLTVWQYLCLVSLLARHTTMRS
jgi:hypothetical protein